MLLILLIAVVSYIFLWVIVKWSRVKRFWITKGVPHHSPSFIVGSLQFFLKYNPSIWFRQMFKDFPNSPYVGIWLFWKPAVLVHCPELAQRILVKDFEFFKNRFLSSGNTDPIGASNIFSANDPVWSMFRRRLAVSFTSSKLKSLHNLFSEKSKLLIERIVQENTKSKLVRLRTMYVDFTTDVVGEAAFGVASTSVKTGDSVIRSITKNFMSFSVHRMLSWNSIFFIPQLVDYFRFAFFPKSSVEELRRILKVVVKQRGGYWTKLQPSKDWLDVLMKLKYEEELEGKEITEDMILAQAAILLLGGFDTSGSIVTWITYMLALNPEFQDKLYVELKDVKDRIDGEELNSIHLAEIHYLTAVIKETLRFFPPMGWIDRVSSSPYQIDENVTIPAGTPVFINTFAIHKNAKYFPDPEKFDPTRFMPENDESKRANTFLAFGDGPRICIGMRFAMQTVRYALSSIFLNFKVSLPPNALSPDEYLATDGLFMMPNVDLSAIFTPRHECE